MTKIDIISGFLGAGKTTFIKKILEEAIAGERVVLIENEFGEIGIDGGFLKDAGIEIREMNSGCICCSLVGDFGASLAEVLTKYKPERVIIEPSGVGKLSDVIKAVRDVAAKTDVALNSAVTIVDAAKCKMYMKNFGEFFNNQIEHAGTVVLSRTDVADEAKVQKDVELIREHNKTAAIITTPCSRLSGAQLLEIIEKPDTMEEDLMSEVQRRGHKNHHHNHEKDCSSGHDEHCGCGHVHDHEEHCGSGQDHDHGEHCGSGQDQDHGEHCGSGHDYDHGEHCGSGHDQDHGEHCGSGQDHDHGEHCGCGQDHDHGEHCGCGHHHHHEGHHHADEVFTSWGREHVMPITKTALDAILDELANGNEYGDVLRAKGMLPAENLNEWFYFDLVPDEYEIRMGKPDYTGKVCVIGAGLDEEKLAKAFDRS